MRNKKQELNINPETRAVTARERVHHKQILRHSWLPVVVAVEAERRLDVGSPVSPAKNLPKITIARNTVYSQAATGAVAHSLAEQSVQCSNIMQLHC